MTEVNTRANSHGQKHTANIPHVEGETSGVVQCPDLKAESRGDGGFVALVRIGSSSTAIEGLLVRVQDCGFAGIVEADEQYPYFTLFAFKLPQNCQQAHRYIFECAHRFVAIRYKCKRRNTVK